MPFMAGIQDLLRAEARLFPRTFFYSEACNGIPSRILISSRGREKVGNGLAVTRDRKTLAMLDRTQDLREPGLGLSCLNNTHNVIITSQYNRFYCLSFMTYFVKADQSLSAHHGDETTFLSE